jgi:hypothetical protein
METKCIWPALLNDKDRECFTSIWKILKQEVLKCVPGIYRETEMYVFKPILI